MRFTSCFELQRCRRPPFILLTTQRSAQRAVDGLTPPPPLIRRLSHSLLLQRCTLALGSLRRFGLGFGLALRRHTLRLRRSRRLLFGVSFGLLQRTLCTALALYLFGFEPLSLHFLLR
jgi:hypothetical protein